MDLIYTLEKIDDALVALIPLLNNLKVVAVIGEMGAGKTTFIHAVCRKLGVTGTMSSPTFPIIHQYEAANGQVIHHVDAYRLKDVEEAMQAGVQESIESGELCFIEWPQRITEILPLHFISIFIEPVNSTTRKLTVTTG